MRQVKLFISNMFVLKDISIDDVIQYNDISLYRDVKFFVRKIKHVTFQHDFNVYWIIHVCFLNSAKRWHNENDKNFENSKFNDFCQILLNRFDKEYESKRQKQVQKTRIIKQQVVEKTRAEIFACRHCSIKYSNNIQLHKHVQEHHIKKIKIKIFIISISVSIFSVI